MSANRGRAGDVGSRRADLPHPNDSATRIRAAGRAAVAVNHEVVITGIGMILPGCDTREVFWQQLRDGESQLTMEFDNTRRHLAKRALTRTNTTRGDVGQTVAYFASPFLRNVTAETLTVDGGFSQAYF
jgi:NAD(P)-dependent dehydrogenase (short-subunit alcohol dehydrogenase family)